MQCLTCDDNTRTIAAPLCLDCDRRLFAKVTPNAYAAWEMLRDMIRVSISVAEKADVPSFSQRLSELRAFGIPVKRQTCRRAGGRAYSKWFLDLNAE